MELNVLRKELNPRQKALREALKGSGNREDAIPLFLTLHGILHSAQVAPDAPWSYEDLLLDGVDEPLYRLIPKGELHSLIWIIWHLSRIEDITMTFLTGGRDQVYNTEGWDLKIHAPFRHTGNGTGPEDIEALSLAVDIPALRAYRHAVGHSTREVVKDLTPDDFKHKTQQEHLDKILAEGDISPEGKGVVDYWSRLDVAGLLLMPPTRHTMVHWNEARQILRKLKK
jgi:hypothetical protein